MPRNPFTDDERTARLKLGLDGLADTLRSPEVLRAIIMEHKPATVSVGDFTLKALLDEIIDAQQSHGDYRAIYRLLGTLFDEKVPSGTDSAKRHFARTA